MINANCHCWKRKQYSGPMHCQGTGTSWSTTTFHAHHTKLTYVQGAYQFYWAFTELYKTHSEWQTNSNYKLHIVHSRLNQTKIQNRYECTVFFVASWIYMFLPPFYTNNAYLTKVIGQPDKMPQNRDCDHWIPWNWDSDSKQNLKKIK